jgi:uncharacterized membrane protein YeaQ/YmgE (transglycosylase-associated protein family)
LLTKKRGASYIISFIIICFFAGFGASYFLENNFGLLTTAVLGIAGILLCLGGAVSALLNWNKVDAARGTGIKKNALQITSGWNYRPREAFRRFAAVHSAGAETADVLSPQPFAMNNNVWFNDDSLECAARTFINLDPTVEDATTQARFRRTTKVL